MSKLANNRQRKFEGIEILNFLKEISAKIRTKKGNSDFSKWKHWFGLWAFLSFVWNFFELLQFQNEKVLKVSHLYVLFLNFSFFRGVFNLLSVKFQLVCCLWLRF